MDSENSAPLERSVSQQSATSYRSHRSTVRASSKSKQRAKLVSQASSSASSIIDSSDKSLTSFPSFSPKSPRVDNPFFNASPPPGPDLYDGAGLSSQRKSPDPQSSASIVESLTAQSDAHAPGTLGGPGARGSLFEDAPPIPTTKIPGALHQADDAHIQRLISKHGAVPLVRQIAEDLAERDAQLAALRRRADEKERILRKIILECGLSNMELETRLRTIEQEEKTSGRARQVSDLMSDAMSNHFPYGYNGGEDSDNRNDRTIRGQGSEQDPEANKGTIRAWKDYLWGTSKKSSRSSSVDNSQNKNANTGTVIRQPDRRPTMPEDLFTPPEAGSLRSSSRASSIQTGQAGQGGRKASLASKALRLVAGGAQAARENEARGRADSSSAAASLRGISASSQRTSASATAASSSAQQGPRGLMAMRRATGGGHGVPIAQSTRPLASDRWDTMVMSPSTEMVARQESYGPVEMDTMFAPEDQPPTLTHIYNNYLGAEYLTDRYGFIYDQRRKKRQREASLMANSSKRSSRQEMLTNGRMTPLVTEEPPAIHQKWDIGSDSGRPGTPSSMEEAQREEGKPKRWQDYLKYATAPTELLSHTPAMNINSIEVLEGGDLPPTSDLPPKSPGITTEDRGFVPITSTPTTAVDHETVATPDGDPPVASTSSSTLSKDDAEPVKLLLDQLSELHDTLQQARTIRWNEFLRKVRAERKREGEAAALAATTSDGRRPPSLMPETRLADGEIIGVAALGIKGRLGRAKWNEFRTLILGGIPVALRAKVWAECSGANQLRVPGYYDDLVARPAESDSAEVVQQIKADIHRTLTDNIFFRKGPGVTRLNEVLLAYARRNPDVGYCQGMNLIAANLLLVTPSAEDAFWLLTSFIEAILPHGYYDHSLLASRADQQVLRAYVAEVLPRLSRHFDALSIDLETMTFQWFLSVFTDCLSAEALFRVWDVVLCSPGDGSGGPSSAANKSDVTNPSDAASISSDPDPAPSTGGSAFLFAVALALLKLNEAPLLRLTSPAAVYTYINHQMTNHAISIDGLVHASEALRRVVRREDVEVRRAKAMKAEREVQRARDERRREVVERRRSKEREARRSAAEGEDLIIGSVD